MTFKRITILIIFTLFAIFTLQNAEQVDIKFFFWKTAASRSLILFSAFGIGLITGWLTRIRKKRTDSKAPVSDELKKEGV